jgi:signal transduction histidine kinase/ActR/RegA family two-component response regulator
LYFEIQLIFRRFKLHHPNSETIANRQVMLPTAAHRHHSEKEVRTMIKNVQAIFLRHAVLAFALGGLLAVSGSLFMTWTLVSRTTHNSVLNSTEAAILALTEVFVNEVWSDIRPWLPPPAAGPEIARNNANLFKLDERIRTFGHGTDIIKVKVYDLKGLVVYSSETKQIGDNKGENGGFISALNGKPASELTFRDKFSTFDGELQDRSLVSTYAPVRSHGSIVAVIEIYADRTASLDYTDAELKKMLRLLVPIFLVVYVGMLSFVFWNDKARRKYEESLVELAEENATARREAEKATLVKSQFLATMSHEIRTPMNGILGMAQLLLMPNLKEDERHDYARTIFSSGQVLLTLLNDILDLSKIEAGKIQLDAIVFEPSSLLSEIETLFLGAAQTKILRMTNQWTGSAKQRYLADAHRLRQMISNLVGNAIKFSSQGSIHLEGAEIERKAEIALLEFSVADNGIGIPKDKLDLLFKPFSQTESSITRKFGGSGLGLSIVSQLAKLMGGDVGVESVLGQGSRFWFRVWVNCAPDVEGGEQVKPSTEDHINSASQTDQFSGHVLVVEDNMVNRMVIESLLESLGITVTLLNDGQQAVDAITNGDQKPDLILMDLHMPVMDGYTAVTQIRQWEADQQSAAMPIIALTADAFEEDRQHCMAVGMNDFLTKPIELSALKSALSKWLVVKTEY